MLAAPTGAGKTLMAATIAQGVLNKGRRFAFIVPYLSLIDQTVARFEQYGMPPSDIGVIQGDHPRNDPAAPVQVCSRDTLSRRNLHPAVDLVAIDEAHVNSKWLFGWMQQPTGPKFIGLSATPWTKGLGKYFDDLVVGSTTAELIDAGFLSPFRVFAPGHPDLAGIKTVAGDYHQGELGDRMGDDGLVADVVGTWLQRAERQPTLVFAVDRAHAKKLQNRFEAAGVPSGYVDAFTKAEDREDIGRRFNAKQLPIVVNVGCLVAGVDWDVRCIVMARPTRSEIFHVQSIGRALRPAPGKEDALILDHSDNHLRLGFVTDLHCDELDDGTTRKVAEREREAPLPKECPKCHFVKPPKIALCPSCGFKPERQSEVEEAEGELVELRGSKKKKRDATMAEKQLWFSGLLHIARRRGYKDGWASNQYRERFGVWPKSVQWISSQPTPEIEGWVKSRQIAYAKRKVAA